MAPADIDEGLKPGLGSDERAELVRLRRANRVLEMENRGELSRTQQRLHRRRT
jgi:hypothetical protein